METKNSGFLYWAKVALVAGLSIIIWQTAIFEYIMFKDLRPRVNATAKQVQLIATDTKALVIDVQKHFVHDNEILTNVQTKTFDTLDNVNANLTKTVDTFNNKLGPTLDNVNGLVTDSRILVQNTDYNVNDPVEGLIPVTRDMILDLHGKIVVLIDNQVAGLLDATTDNINQIGQQVSDTLGGVKVVVAKAETTMDNVNNATFYIAKIAEEGAKLSEFYTGKLMHPSKLEMISRYLNLAGFLAGDILIPWLAVKDVRVIN